MCAQAERVVARRQSQHARPGARAYA